MKLAIHDFDALSVGYYPHMVELTVKIVIHNEALPDALAELEDKLNDTLTEVRRAQSLLRGER